MDPAWLRLEMTPRLHLKKAGAADNRLAPNKGQDIDMVAECRLPKDRQLVARAWFGRRRLARRVRKSDAVKIVGEEGCTPQKFPPVWGIAWGKKKGLQPF